MKSIGLAAFAGLLVLASAHSATVDFEDLSLAPGSYWLGSDNSGGFSSGSAQFNHAYTDWGGFFTWAGFLYSNVNDPVTPGYFNQFAVASGTGLGGSGNYAIGFDDKFSPDADTLALPEASLVKGFYINNTTYTALSMALGDTFAKKFGGPTGADPDWLKVEITGRDGDGLDVGTVEHYLADFRFADNAEDYIQTDWRWIDLTSFGESVKTLHFSVTSSDVSPFGPNTPTYFAMDNLEYIPASELPPPADCVRRASYWASNPAAWTDRFMDPILTLDLTGADPACDPTVLTAVDALALMEATSAGDVTIKLAQELIAALLNQARGADVSEAVIQEAKDFLCVVPAGSDPDHKALKKAAKSLAKDLREFNRGKRNLPACGSGSGGSRG